MCVLAITMGTHTLHALMHVLLGALWLQANCSNILIAITSSSHPHAVTFSQVLPDILWLRTCYSNMLITIEDFSGNLVSDVMWSIGAMTVGG